MKIWSAQWSSQFKQLQILPTPPNKKKIQDFNTIWTHGPTCVSAAVLHQEIKK